MPTCGCGAITEIKEGTGLTIALAGNPNVGKSSIFNQLTGSTVVTANYPGKTVQLNIATTVHDDQEIGIIDLPGTYAVGSISEDQWVARRAVLDGAPDSVMVVVDATNLARNLYMVLQFLDMEMPVVVALNLEDQAERRGISTDTNLLSRLLGVPVVPTVAIRGRGLDEAVHAAIAVARGEVDTGKPPKYGKDVEGAINSLAQIISGLPELNSLGLTPRGLATLLLEDDEEFAAQVRELPCGEYVLQRAAEAADEISGSDGETAPLRIARERHGLAGSITEQVQNLDNLRVPLVDRLWRYTTAPLTGLPILVGVLAALFAFLFYVGGLISTGFTLFWGTFISPVIQGAFYGLLGKNVISTTLLWGADAGIAAALGVGIPYILTFYFVLAILEDTGYLNSVAFLTDRVMHRFGLHGRSIIPLVAGAGCNVPAIIGTRVLTSKRERTIASTLIVMVPCSARTAVILGAVSLYSGWLPAVALFIVVMVIIAFVGVGLNKVMPGKTSGLVMEMFPFRVPSLKAIAKKTWARFHEFVFVATPIVLVGSIVLGGLYETKLLWYLTGPLSPVVEGWLGLPIVAGLGLVFAILRKELALQLLVAMAIIQYGAGANNLLQFMSPNQIWVYALVNTLYIPCIATIAVLGKELGWSRTAGITVFTITVATFLGGIAARILPLFG
jgi:ferrous iron transport protein B